VPALHEFFRSVSRRVIESKCASFVYPSRFLDIFPTVMGNIDRPGRRFVATNYPHVGGRGIDDHPHRYCGHGAIGGH